MRALSMTVIAIALDIVSPAGAATLIVLDNSGSMSDALPGGGSKASVAAHALSTRFLPALPAGESTALWTFGGWCGTLQHQGSFDPSGGGVERELGRIGAPRGGTPLAQSVSRALVQVQQQPPPRNLLVITDGLDTCGGDPCAEIRGADAEDTRVTVHTVGLGMARTGRAFRTLQCMADASLQGTARVLEPGSGGAQLGDLLASLGEELEEPTGELIVRLHDPAGSERTGVPFAAVSVERGIEHRGETGRPLTLAPGAYRLHGGDTIDSVVHVAPGRRAEHEVASELGRVLIRGRCLDGASFSLEDATGRTVQTGALTSDVPLDLPPGNYRVLLTQFPELGAQLITVARSRARTVEVAGLATVEVKVRDAAGRELTLAIEIFDDGAASGDPPIATGETNRPFRVPAGTYNLRVSPDDERAGQFAGLQNLRVDACERVETELRQRAALLVCGAGPVRIWNDADGRLTQGRAGAEIPLNPGLYNVDLPDGSQLFNLLIGEGLNRVRCH